MIVIDKISRPHPALALIHLLRYTDYVHIWECTMECTNECYAIQEKYSEFCPINCPYFIDADSSWRRLKHHKSCQNVSIRLNTRAKKQLDKIKKLTGLDSGKILVLLSRAHIRDETHIKKLSRFSQYGLEKTKKYRRNVSDLDYRELVKILSNKGYRYSSSINKILHITLWISESYR